MWKIWLVLGVLWMGGGAKAQELPGAAADVECGSCGGTGETLGECWTCGGDRTHACPTCRSFSGATRKRWDILWQPEAVAEFYIIAATRLMDLKFPKFPGLAEIYGGKRKQRKPTKLRPGEIGCHAKCKSGKLFYITNWIDCKVCKSGKFRCPTCKKGKVRCFRCKGAWKLNSACDDCAGLGRVMQSKGLGLEQCPWCADKKTRRCDSCDNLGRVREPCPKCLGEGEIVCTNCKGQAKVTCKKCRGRGRYGPQRKSCPDCSKEGTVECEVCHGEATPCRECKGKQETSKPCPHCGGTKQHPCNGCSAGAYLAWERTAERVRLLGDLERARGWLGAARGRCEKRYTNWLKLDAKKGGDELRRERRKSVQAEFKRELQRIDKQLKSMKSSDKPELRRSSVCAPAIGRRPRIVTTPVAR